VSFTADQIDADLRPHFRGGLHFDDLTCGLYATDASPFQVAPLGVAVPHDADDLAVLVAYASETSLPLIPRGAGTGLAGESLGPGLVVDLSVHLRAIPQIGPDWVHVEAGVTLAELNAALAPCGRRFAPDPASGATCTIGGMIATNASGGTVFRHGYTRDYVRSLRVIWDDGTPDEVCSPPSSAVPEARGRGNLTAALLSDNRDLIELTRPHTAYNRCGYVLHDVLTPAGPDLARLLVGSEGTLAFITAATVQTVPLPGGVCRFVLGFGSLDDALKAGLALRHHDGIAGCELLDQRLLSLSRAARPAEGVGLVPPSVAAALVGVVEAASEREAVRLGNAVVAALRRDHRLGVLAEPTCEPEDLQRIITFREAAVSGLYALGRGRRPEAFIEDVAVPVEEMPAFTATVRDLLRDYDLTGSFLIHVLTGQVQCRPLVDLADPTDREKLWPLAEAVHKLALAVGGTISTRHGTGIARTPWVEKQYGPLLPVFRELKRIFDPKHILNPGKILGPDPSRPAWPLRTTGLESAKPAEPPAEPRRPLLVWDQISPAEEASRCNGCGDCRTRSAGIRMCPVFRATGTEHAAPRAKANLLKLILETDPSRLSTDDVRAVADLCVNCKMCRDECRAKVDVPKLMLEAKATHHAEHGLDRTDWFFARIEGLAALAGNFAFTSNTLLGTRWTRWAVEKLFGVSRTRTLPRFTHRTFLRRARRAGLTTRHSPAADDSGPPGHRVAYFADTFTNYNDPLIGEAAVAVLRYHGFEVHVPRQQRGSGMAALSYGDTETAREYAVYNVRTLAELVRDGYTVVCSEPAAALALTQDYLHLLDTPDAKLVSANTVELTAFLWSLHQGGKLRTTFRELPVGVGHHVPCHLKALGRPPAGPKLLSLIPGTRVYTIDVSCSGMAGTWGLKRENHAASLTAGQPMLDELNRPRVLYGSTECGTCRLQMQDGSGKRTLHPVQYLALAYGLLPEIEQKLTKPLRPLLTD
jgi:FAD/FMN-containing dehydrogenase/Fe-S oxidoreductase